MSETTAPLLATRDALAEVLLAHRLRFAIMGSSPHPDTRYTWDCSCGASAQPPYPHKSSETRYLLLDERNWEAMRHQADALLGVVRDPATLADVQIRHHATMRPASHDKWWIWNCKICGTSGSATETGCRAEVESHNRMTSAPMTPHIARALAAALTEDPS